MASKEHQAGMAKTGRALLGLKETQARVAKALKGHAGNVVCGVRLAVLVARLWAQEVREASEVLPDHLVPMRRRSRRVPARQASPLPRLPSTSDSPSTET